MYVRVERLSGSPNVSSDQVSADAELVVINVTDEEDNEYLIEIEVDRSNNKPEVRIMLDGSECLWSAVGFE